MLLQKRTSSAIFVAIDTKKQRMNVYLKKKKYEQHALADCRNDDQQLFKKTKQYLLMRGEIK